MAYTLRMCSRTVRLHNVFSLSRPCVRSVGTLVATEHGEEDEEVQYPPIKPQWPPGSWGNMSKKHSWLLWEKMNQLKTPGMSVSDRIKALSPKPERTWSCPSVQHYPKSFEYQQYITKTHMVSGMPQFYETLEEQALAYLPTIKTLVEEAVLLEHCNLDRSHINYEPVCQAWKVTSLKTGQIINCLLSALAADNPHLETCQLGEDVRVRAFWDRYGIPQQPSKEMFDPQNESHIKMYSRYNTEFMCTQIRTELPIPQFVSRDNTLCTESEYAQFNYWPKDLSQVSTVVENTCIPGFFQGDPCEFGLVSFHCPTRLNLMEKKYGREIAYEMQKGMGLVTSFTWAVAQAYFQGFNTYMDITYPFTSQIVITDGQKFSFFAYQLNTLELWKDDTANHLRNICWYTEEENLFEIKDGQIHNFNDNVLKQLIKFFINRPADRGCSLRPYLTDNPRYITEYINPKL